MGWAVVVAIAVRPVDPAVCATPLDRARCFLQSPLCPPALPSARCVPLACRPVGACKGPAPPCPRIGDTPPSVRPSPTYGGGHGAAWAHRTDGKCRASIQVHSPLSRPTTAQNEGETRPGSEGAPRKCAVWSAVGCCVSLPSSTPKSTRDRKERTTLTRCTAPLPPHIAARSRESGGSPA